MINDRFSAFLSSGSRSLCACVPFTNARRFSTQVAQKVKFGASDTAALDDIDVIDDSRVQGEDSFDADPERRFADCYRLTHVFASTSDHDSLECLQTLFVFTLFDTHVDANSVTRNEIRDIALQLCFFYGLQYVHCRSTSSI